MWVIMLAKGSSYKFVANDGNIKIVSAKKAKDLLGQKEFLRGVINNWTKLGLFVKVKMIKCT